MLVAATAIVESIRDFSLLPDRLASHFNAAGFPNNWLEKPQFFALYAGLIVLAASITFLSLPLIMVTPAWALNLPHKQYWLSDAQARDTYSYLDRYFAWSGLCLLAFEVFTMHLVLGANLQAAPRLPIGILFLFLGAFVLIAAGSTIALLRRFSHRPDDAITHTEVIDQKP